MNFLGMGALVISVYKKIWCGTIQGCGTIYIISRINDKILRIVPQCSTIRGCSTNRVNTVFMCFQRPLSAHPVTCTNGPEPVMCTSICTILLWFHYLQFARHAAEMRPFQFSQVSQFIWCLDVTILLQSDIPAIRQHMVLELLKKSLVTIWPFNVQIMTNDVFNNSSTIPLIFSSNHHTMHTIAYMLYHYADIVFTCSHTYIYYILSCIDFPA